LKVSQANRRCFDAQVSVARRGSEGGNITTTLCQSVSKYGTRFENAGMYFDFTMMSARTREMRSVEKRVIQSFRIHFLVIQMSVIVVRV